MKKLINEVCKLNNQIEEMNQAIVDQITVKAILSMNEKELRMLRVSTSMIQQIGVIETEKCLEIQKINEKLDMIDKKLDKILSK